MSFWFKCWDKLFTMQGDKRQNYQEQHIHVFSKSFAYTKKNSGCQDKKFQDVQQQVKE